MPEIDITEDVLKYVRAFKKVIDALIEDSELNISESINLIIRVGIEKMLRDLLPKAYTENGAELLQENMVEMFKEKPDFIAEFVVKTMERGRYIREETFRQERESWMSYIG